MGMSMPIMGMDTDVRFPCCAYSDIPMIENKGISVLSQQQLDDYLARIDYHGPRAATPEVLRALHLAHLRHVPFENLDIGLGIAIDLAFDAVFDKVVRRRRGGFCYELNYTFSALLATLGFDVALLSARVFNGDSAHPEQAYSAAFDHMLVLVRCRQRLWIADVGFGDCFLEPLLLGGTEVEQGGIAYIVAQDAVEADYVVMHRHPRWQPRYRFTLVPYAIGDFAARCLYQQTSPESHFTRKSICSIATAAGRTTLSNDKLIETISGQRGWHSIGSEAEYRAALATHFQIGLPPDAAIDKIFVVK